MQRILVMNAFLSRRYAGAANASLTLVNSLASRGDLEVSAFAFEADEHELDPGVRLIRGRTPEPRRFWWRFPTLGLVRSLEAELRRADVPAVDLCYTRSTALGLAFRSIFPDTPVVSHTGAVLPDREYHDEAGRPLYETAVEGFLVNRLERRAYRESNWVHVVSTPLVAEQRVRHYGMGDPEFFRTFPLPINEGRFTPAEVTSTVRADLGISDGAFVVVAVARLVAWKRLDMLIQALSGTDPSIHLLIVGEGPERARLTELTRELGVAERVHLPGFAHPAPYLKAADLFALPSALESFGLAYAEAMHMGLPCIGAQADPPQVLSSASDVIPEGAGFCIRTAEELRERIRQLSEQRELCRELGRFAQSWARSRYTPQAYTEFLLETMEELLRSRRPATLASSLS